MGEKSAVKDGAGVRKPCGNYGSGCSHTNVDDQSNNDTRGLSSGGGNCRARGVGGGDGSRVGLVVEVRELKRE